MRFGNSKDELLYNFARNIISEQFLEAHEQLSKWEESYIEDFHIANMCRAFLLLRDSPIEKAINLFEEHFSKALLDEEISYSILHIFYGCIDRIKHNSFNLSSDSIMGKIILCKRGWKIKAVLGAILVGTGSIVAVVNPDIGSAMITTGLGFVADGTIDSVDEHDEMRKRDAQKRREEEELKKTEFQPKIGVLKKQSLI